MEKRMHAAPTRKSLKVWLPTIRARSGSDVYVVRLAKALEARGHRPLIQWLPHHYQYCPWRLKSLAMPPGTDIVQTNSWNAFALKRQGIPLVAVVLHCVYKQGFPAWKTLPQSIYHDHFVGRFEKISFRVADVIVAISNSTASDVQKDFDVSNIRTIPLWLDASRFVATTEPALADSGRTAILIVGNLSKRKGGDLLGSFCNALGSDFEVTVVAGLRQETLSNGDSGAQLTFRSGLSEEDLISAYQSADIIVSLSRHEGFGYTALEGMACCKPVVAFNVGGLRDVVVHGKTGYLVEAEQVNALADACRQLRNNPVEAARFGANGRKRAVSVFSEETALNNYLALYEELLDTALGNDQ